jgi:hypothetical protein
VVNDQRVEEEDLVDMLPGVMPCCWLLCCCGYILCCGS